MHWTAVYWLESRLGGGCAGSPSLETRSRGTKARHRRPLFIAVTALPTGRHPTATEAHGPPNIPSRRRCSSAATIGYRRPQMAWTATRPHVDDSTISRRTTQSSDGLGRHRPGPLVWSRTKWRREPKGVPNRRQSGQVVQATWTGSTRSRDLTQRRPGDIPSGLPPVLLVSRLREGDQGQSSLRCAPGHPPWRTRW
jgi:hypothetical protein